MGTRTLIVTPTYNEKDNIERFVAAVRGAFPEAHLWIVDDNSPDGTGDIADRIAEKDDHVRVIHRPGKLGLGTAYTQAFQQGLGEGFDRFFEMDADLSHDVRYLPDFVKALDDGADVVIGSRYVPGGATADWPLHRRLLSRWGNRYTGVVLGLGVRDATSGFRAYRATAMRDIDPSSTTAEGYAFLTELVRRLVVKGHPVREVPIVFRDREFGTSKMSSRIIVESMLLVTRWGVSDIVHRRRPKPAR